MVLANSSALAGSVATAVKTRTAAARDMRTSVRPNDETLSSPSKARERMEDLEASLGQKKRGTLQKRAQALDGGLGGEVALGHRQKLEADHEFADRSGAQE